MPENNNQRQVFIQNVGNWTNELYQYLKRNTHRPLWIQGPFASSFHHAHNYDNQILVATGIGITPILSTARAYMSSRRVNMIWIVREPDVLEFYLEYLSMNTDGWLIAFYTGRKPLSPLLEEYWSHTNVRIIKGRPDLNVLIPGLIYGIESRVGLPESFYNDKKERAIYDVLNLYKSAQQGNEDLEDSDILENAFALARSHGFQLTALVREMEKKNRKIFPESRQRLSQRLSYMLSTSMHGIEGDIEESNKDIERGNRKQFGGVSIASIEIEPQNGQHHASKPTSLITEVLKVYDKNNKGRTWRKPSMGFTRRPSNHFLPSNVSYEPWRLNDLAPNYVKNLDKQVIDTWGKFYCNANKQSFFTNLNIQALYFVVETKIYQRYFIR